MLWDSGSSFKLAARLNGTYRYFQYHLIPHMPSLPNYQNPTPKWYIDIDILFSPRVHDLH